MTTTSKQRADVFNFLSSLPSDESQMPSFDGSPVEMVMREHDLLPIERFTKGAVTDSAYRRAEAWCRRHGIKTKRRHTFENRSRFNCLWLAKG